MSTTLHPPEQVRVPAGPAHLPRLVWRFRVAAACLVLTTLCFLQDPGRVAADTKLDLTQDPWAFLGRALHLWNDQAFFGQLQNQAYGYLWPMGPFFGLLRSAGVAPWVAQRLWWSLLLCLALLGMLRLLRLLGVDQPWARLVGALSFALAPRVMTVLGPTSIEAWPLALAPWMLIPLVRGSLGGSPRRWAAASGVAVLCMGGVNAVATAAVLPLGAAWLLTRDWGPRTRRLWLWWAASVGAATLWWVVPLVSLGRYSPPFLDWIESSAITTSQADPASSLRGTTDWVAYVVGATGPLWRAGWSLVSVPWLAAAGAVVVAAGAAGLTLRATRERLFLTGTLLLGLALVGLGHVEAPTGLGAPAVRSLLDGALAPLRNTHKFAPLVAVPLAVGVAWAWQALWERRAGAAGSRRGAWTAVAVATAAAVGAMGWPLLAQDITRGRTYLEIPQYWREAAVWLDANAGDGRALVVPGSSFGDYLWGRPQDEPLQALLQSAAWSVRDSVPLSSAGTIRFMDEVEARLAAGNGSPGLSEALARAGVGWLVVRNDLEPVSTGEPPLPLVHEALRASGATQVASFGPSLWTQGSLEAVADDGVRAAYPAVQVYEVPRAGIEDLRVAVSGPATGLVGGPESTVGLADAGLLGGALVLPGDGAATTSVLTDSYRRAEANFGAMRNQYSQTMGADAPWVLPRAVHDYVISGSGLDATTAVLQGASVTASSSGAEPNALWSRSPASQPWSALDGDPATAWRPGAVEPEGSWWELQLPSTVEVPAVTIEVASAAWPVTVGARWIGGSATVTVDSAHPVEIPVGAAISSLRLTVQGPAGHAPAGLTEVSLPGVTPTRMVVTGGAASAGLLMEARRGGRESCADLSTSVVCTPWLTDPGEEHAGLVRAVDLTAPVSGDLSLRVRPRPGAAFDRLLASTAGTRVTATSARVRDAAARPAAVYDGDITTTWVAADNDAHPALTFAFPEAVTLSGVALGIAPDAAVSRPLRVSITGGGVTQELFVPEDGVIRWAPRRMDELTIAFTLDNPVRSVGRLGGEAVLPVGVSEVSFIGATPPPASLSSLQSLSLPCGAGPVVQVDGDQVQTRLTAVVGDLLRGRTATAHACTAPVDIPAGRHVITAESAAWLVDSMAITPAVAAGAGTGTATVVEWDGAHRAVRLDAASGERVLRVSGNFNPGWSATLEGVPLHALRLDGWQQGFVVPAGAAGVVQMEFLPERTYRGGLIAGALAVVLLLALALWPARRSALPSAAGRAPGRVLAPVLAGIVALLIAGPAGLLGAGAGFVVARRWPRARVPAAAAGALVAVLMLAVVPWPGRAEAPALLGWLLSLPVAWLVGVLTGALADVPRGGSTAAPGAPPRSS